MKRYTLIRFCACAIFGLSLATTAGCTGPNPVFSIGQTAINSTVMTFVSTFWTNVINGN